MGQVNTYEELMSLVEERRKDRLVLQVDVGAAYSQEHEDAKRELEEAKAFKKIAGDQSFLADNMEELIAKVEATRPEPICVWLVYNKLDLKSWSMLVKQSRNGNLTPMEQYEKVLAKTFVGIFNDPAADEEHLISNDHKLVSVENDKGILNGGMMAEVVGAFVAWQNSGGEVSVHPTKSGQG